MWDVRFVLCCVRFGPTHGDVVNLHTVKREGGRGGSLLSRPFRHSAFFFLSSVVLFIRSLSLSLSLLSLSSPLSRSLCLSLFVGSLFLFTMTMTMSSRRVGSLCERTALTCPKGQSAWTLAHSSLTEHVRIMQERTVLV